MSANDVIVSEHADDVIEGGGQPRRRAPRSVIVGLEAVCVAVVVVWAALSRVEHHSEPAVKPTPGPAVAPTAPVEIPPLDPAVAGDRLQPREVHGRLSLIMVQNRISMVVPATPGQELPDGKGGWTRYGSNYLSKDTVGPQGAEAVFYWTRLHGGGWANQCPGLVNFPAGSSGAAVAAAVAQAPGVALVSGPSGATVGRAAAQHLVLTIREDLGCDPGYFYSWQAVAGGPFWARTGVGDTIRVWIVEMEGGAPLFIAGETTKVAGPDLEQEIEQIVESIRFG